MTTGLPGPVVQLAYLVEDLEKAACSWIEQGAGPFFVTSPSNAMGQFGSLMIELKPVGAYGTDDPPGLHHVASLVDDYDAAAAAFAQRGHRVLRSGKTPRGVPYAFFDTRAALGHEWEIYPRHPRLMAVYETVAAGAVEWDGTSPVRHVTFDL
jgi:hypothetical protein